MYWKFRKNSAIFGHEMCEIKHHMIRNSNFLTYSDSWEQIDINRHRNFENRSICLPIRSFLKLISNILVINNAKSTVLCRKRVFFSNQLIDFQNFCVYNYLLVSSYQILPKIDLMSEFCILWPKMALFLQNFQCIKLKMSKLSAGRTDMIL